MTLQERDELFLKRNRLVVLLLTSDVIAYRIRIGLTYAECAISRLPRERVFLRPGLVNPP